MGYDEWGETDYCLTQGFAAYQANICPCGCGQWRDDCTNPDLAGRWQIVTETCYAGQAVAEFQKTHSDLPQGTLVGVRLLGDGEEATDPMEYDPARAAAEYEAHKKRFGLT